MTRKNKVKSLLLLTVAVISSVSCTQELISKEPSRKQASPNATESISQIRNAGGILFFKSTEHFDAAVEELSNLSGEERLAYSEELLGNESFVLRSEEFYGNLNLEEFDEEDLQVLLQEYPNSVTVEESVGHGISVLPALHNVTEKYFLNSHGMYLIDSMVYKCFNDSVTIATINDGDGIAMLKALQENELEVVLSGSGFYLIGDLGEDYPNYTNSWGNNNSQPDNNYHSPFGSKKDEIVKYSNDKKYRTRVIVKAKTSSNWIKGTNKGTLKTTVINEQKGKCLWWTKWRNKSHYTEGNIFVNTNGCIYDITRNNYINWSNKPEWQLVINESVKDETWEYTVFNVVRGNGGKSWLRIAKVSGNLSVPSIGVFMNK